MLIKLKFSAKNDGSYKLLNITKLYLNKSKRSTILDNINSIGFDPTNEEDVKIESIDIVDKSIPFTLANLINVEIG